MIAMHAITLSVKKNLILLIPGKDKLSPAIVEELGTLIYPPETPVAAF